jgi:predicted dienelactone hydrolase
MGKLPVLLAALATIFLSPVSAALAQHVEHGVGFQWGSAPDPGGVPLKLAIWYPSEAPAQPTQVGPYRLDVAMDGAPSGRALPLIVMSHGIGGSSLDSSNLAVSLAQAGFVVVAVTHSGDNYEDRSRSFLRRNFADRPRHVTRAIDFMLSEWPGHRAIDPRRIGIFGHSAGGTTSLIAVGGRFEWEQMGVYCGPHSDGCRNTRERRTGDAGADASAPPIAAEDTRIRAAVVAAPALAHGFQPQSLARVSVPVQVWVAGHDTIAPDAAVLQSLLPPQIDYRPVPDAGHFSFLAPCSAVLIASAPQICRDPPGFDRADFQRRFTKAIVRFFETNLPSTP